MIILKSGFPVHTARKEGSVRHVLTKPSLLIPSPLPANTANKMKIHRENLYICYVLSCEPDQGTQAGKRIFDIKLHKP